MANVMMISSFDPENEGQDFQIVHLCERAGIQRKTEPELPIVSDLDFSCFDVNEEHWVKWNVLDDAIRKLMFVLHDQFRQKVQLMKLDKEVDMVIEKKCGGLIGQERVYSLTEYTNLYTLVFELVSNERLGRSSRALFARYKSRCAFFSEYHVRQNVAMVADGKPLLKVLVATSKNFWTFLDIMNQIFMALDSSRIYSIHDSRPSIDTHGKQEFYNDIFDTNISHLKLRIVDSMLEVYRSLRYAPAGCDVTSYTDVVSEVFDVLNSCYDVFAKDYCEHLIKDVFNFYMALGEFWRTGKPTDERYVDFFPSFAGSGMVDLATYAQLCETSLTIELDLQDRLHSRQSVKKKVEKEMYNALIHVAVGPDKIFNPENFNILFHQDNFSELQRLFSMFKSNTQAMRIMSESLQAYIIKEGKDLIAHYEAEYKEFRELKVQTLFKGTLSDNNKRVLDNACKNKTQVLKDIISKSKEHTKMIDTIFDKSFEMVKGMRVAYGKIAAMKIDGHQQEELLPIYVNRIINRQEQKSDQACEEALLDLSDYFHFLSSKDLFMITHRDFLSKRILSYDSKPNAYLEQFILQRLSAREGVQFTSQAEKQLHDCLEKTDQNRKYEQWASSREELNDLPEFEVQVIAKKAWPVDSNLGLFNSCILPSRLQKLNDSFVEFYSSSTKKRLLEWINRSSLATILFRTSPGSTKVYRIIANGQQTAILSLFTDFDVQLTEAQIKEASGIVQMSDLPSQSDLDHFSKVLRSCLAGKIKLLTKDPDTELYSINTQFTYEDRVVKLPEPYVSVEVDKHEMSEDRSLAIQFAIVKAMKLRKKMRYNDLINETMDQLKQFKPQMRIVKESLDEIISKEWIRRQPDDETQLEYVA
eukprot:GHVH01001771.1.p1 GENE.GHVH01001771.1~~GHVH01001771.1.p1  ORF type:complete len:869 (+),score=125.33 GHVH01001771.1:179-2785(+)